jgi:hypothetical protein
MVMVHKPGLADHDFEHLPAARFPIAELRPFIAAHEAVAGLVAPSRVVAVALNTSLIHDEEEARRLIEATAAETGLPCDDPIRFGGEALWREIESAVDGLPWVTPAETEEPNGRGGPRVPGEGEGLATGGEPAAEPGSAAQP